MSNTLSFDRLQKGLQKISNLGLVEETVTVHGTEFLLRTLRTKDHKEVNSYVGAYMEQYEGEESAYPLDATMDFFTVRKIEPLTHSIQVVGDLDFRGIEYVETGELDSNGNPIKVEKHVFVRDLLRDMDIAVVEVLHRKYSDLLIVAEERAAEQIKFRDPEEELEKVELRRSELYKELDRELPEKKKAPQTITQDMEREESGTAGDLSLDALKEAAFSPVSEEEAEEVVRSREESREAPQAAPKSQKEGAPSEGDDRPEDDEAFEAGGQKFIRLDDPDTPYTEEEQEYLEEQERLFQQRFGEDTPEASEAAKARLQKRRRQPLNQTAPKIQEGNLPSHEKQRPARTRRGPKESTSDLPIAEGFEERDASVLGSSGSEGSKKPSYNPSPSGSKNPRFKDPKK